MQNEPTHQPEPQSKVVFDNDYSLKLHLKAPHFTRSYGVLQTFSSGSSSDTVKYNLDITFVRTIINRSRIFRIERTTEMFVNDSPPDLLADLLAYECGKVFYPLLVEVDFDGKFLAVYNHEEIKARWSTMQLEIKEYFLGEETDKYLVIMTKAILEQEAVDDIFRNDLFCMIFFSSIFKSYGPTYHMEEKLSFPITGSTAAVVFKTTQQVNPLFTDRNTIEIIHSGIVIDERSASDLMQEHRFPIERMTHPDTLAVTGSYTARYILESGTRAVHSIVANWILDLEETQHTEIKIFELIKQKDREVPDIQQPSGMVFLDGNHAKKEGKLTDIFSFLWKH